MSDVTLWVEVRFAIIYRNLMDTQRVSLPEMRRELRRLTSSIRWRWAFVAGAVVGILTPVLAVGAINVYAAALRTSLFFSGGGDPDPGHIERLGYVMGVWGTPVLYLLLTVLAASFVTRRISAAAICHGVLVGVVSVIVSQAIGLYYGPLIPGELAAFVFLGIGGGLLGGMEGKYARAEKEALYEASQHIRAACSPKDLASAVGDNLADPKTNAVALWEFDSPDGQETPEQFELCAVWTPRGMDGEQLSELMSNSISAGLAESIYSGPVTLRAKDLPAQDRGEWKRQGVRSALLMALAAPGSPRSVLLVVTSRRKRLFSKSTIRSYQTIGAQVVLSLENLRLVEEARQAGALRERQRMAHEIHDTLAQGFTSIVMNLEAAEGIRSSANTQAKRHHLDQARSVARASLKEARRLVWSSRPDRLEELEETTLAEALEKLATRFSEESGINTCSTFTGSPRSLPRETESALLRVAGESLTNVRKHARAARAAVTLSYMEDLVVLDIRDDGLGFDTRVNRAVHLVSNYGGGGFGLNSMQERVEGMGGAFSIESAPGEGTTVTVELTMTEDGTTTEEISTRFGERNMQKSRTTQTAEETATEHPRVDLGESARKTD